MKILTTLKDFNNYRSKLNSKSIGFVPTMGALHPGHMSLINQSINDNMKSIVSIYVNPTQFDQVSDLNNYPNHLNEDIKQLKDNGVDAVFIPKYSEIYADNYTFQVQENNLSNLYCGAHREGHFNGVLTVVMKLLNIVSPTQVYLGEKDYQQLTLIRKMVDAFFMKPQVIGCPIIREIDGLAMSSRNLRLDKQQRKLAPQLYKTIQKDISKEQIHQQLSTLGFKVDYIETMDNRLLVAAFLGDIRLIDNVPYHFKQQATQ